MRPTRSSTWKLGTAEQHDFFFERSRLFLMKLGYFGLPAEAFHRYADGQATMQVRLASVIDVVDARGARLTQSETVTLFNDMCMLAPGSLVDAPIDWAPVDDHSVRATFHNAGYTVSAVLSFDDEGDLVGFVSHDRYRSADGKHFELLPWSTPLGSYRQYDGFRLASRGEALWKEATGDFVYARLQLQSVHFDYGSPRAVSVSGLFHRNGVRVEPEHTDVHGRPAESVDLSSARRGAG